jgi:NADH-quinone oxidoreductase subunit C
MTPEAIRDLLAEKLGVEISWTDGTPGDPSATVPAEHWHEACRLARHQDELFLDFLRAESGVDYPDDQAIEVVAHLFSYKHRHGFVLKTRVQRDDPRLKTIEDIWPAANWYEREIFDLLGVHFEGHSDLRRLVLPEDWVGHPLRKDYQEQDSYQGIPTVRPGYPKFEPGGKKKKKDKDDGDAEDKPKKAAKPAAEAAKPEAEAAPAKPATETAPAKAEAEPAPAEPKAPKGDTEEAE